jgi:Xaa-Pro dipeptidase
MSELSSISNSRIEKLSSVLLEDGIDAYFACTPASMGYLHNFFEDSHERLMILAINSDGRSRLICPAVSLTQAQRAGIQDVHSWSDEEDPLELIQELEKDWELRTSLIAVDNHMPASSLLDIQKLLPAALFLKGAPILASLTSVKDQYEEEYLRKASEIAENAFAELLPQIKVGMKELDVRNILYNSMQANEGEPLFAIIAAGPNSAEPHHLTDHTQIKSGDVVIIDFGCKYKGYCSDMTRTICVGKASEEAKKVYKVVCEAHHASRNVISPGKSCKEIDAAGRGIITKAGYGEYFIHRTGHGVGLNLHEAPNISSDNLEPVHTGNYFSIEPGIYLPGQFGVRVENLVIVRENGHESFNHEPNPELIEIF